MKNASLLVRQDEHYSMQVQKHLVSQEAMMVKKELGVASPADQEGCLPVNPLYAADLASAILLDSWEEAVGKVHLVREIDGSVVAGIGPICVLLPGEIGSRLKELQGRRVAVLRTDLDYRLKEIK